MKLVTEDRDRPLNSAALAARTSFHVSSSYDFIVSLRAIYNPDVYRRARHWTFSARNSMGAHLYAEGRMFFEGCETALAYGLLRLIPSLKLHSGPADFIDRLRATAAEECALLMLDTGETTQETLSFYRSALQNPSGRKPGFEADVREVAGDFADRSLDVLKDPNGTKEALVRFLDTYLDKVFASKVDPIHEAVEKAAASAEGLLTMRPTLRSLEALTGGYTVSTALGVNEIILAPSIFIYPFMASRIDERAGQTLIVFGAKNDEILGYWESGAEDVLESLKALANQQRLQILALLLKEPRSGPEFVKVLELSQPTVHHHLAHLRSSGLIRQERTPEGMFYSFRPQAAESLLSRLAEFLGIGQIHNQQ